MTRPSRARIDLSALRHNYLLARQRHGGRALAVVKANAYGHGAVRCAQALHSLADGFAVAFLQEALALRRAGITAPILLLEGVFSAEELLICSREQLWITIHHPQQLQWFEQAPRGHGPWQVWLKVDTGMHRLGLHPNEVANAIERLQMSKRASDVVLMSHLARADEPEAQQTPLQLDAFRALMTQYRLSSSLCNSAGIVAWPEAHGDWARPGLMLYGVQPCDPLQMPLQPVMQLCSEVFAERWVGPGASVGYGGACITQRRTRIGMVAIGYADGYPRAVREGTQVCVAGQKVAVLGRPSMDMLAIDLTDIAEPAGPAGQGTDVSLTGSPVELWGSSIPVATVAAQAGTNAYELLCGVTRVPFEYHA